MSSKRTLLTSVHDKFRTNFYERGNSQFIADNKCMSKIINLPNSIFTVWGDKGSESEL